MHANDHERSDDVRATVRDLIASAESLLAALGEEGMQRYRDAVVGLQRQIARGRDDIDDVQYAAARRARVAARRVDHYVHENPWQSAGVAAGIGAAVGAVVAILIAQRQT